MYSVSGSLISVAEVFSCCCLLSITTPFGLYTLQFLPTLSVTYICTCPLKPSGIVNFALYAAFLPLTCDTSSVFVTVLLPSAGISDYVTDLTPEPSLLVFPIKSVAFTVTSVFLVKKYPYCFGTIATESVCVSKSTPDITGLSLSI